MADVFVSYTRVDQAWARQLSAALESRGWSVWWDRRIPPGRDFNAYIEEQLHAARCIVVLWSAASVASRFVRDEAAEGLSDGRLVPVLIEKGVRQPIGFRQLQAADLSDWDGRGPHDEFERFVGSIEAFVPASSTPATRLPQPPNSSTPDRLPLAEPRPSGPSRSGEREVRNVREVPERPAATPVPAATKDWRPQWLQNRTRVVAAALGVIVLLVTGGWLARGIIARAGYREVRSDVPLAGRALYPIGLLATPVDPVNRIGLEQGARLASAATAFADGDYDRATLLYQWVLDGDPDDPIARAGLTQSRARLPRQQRRVDSPLARDQDAKQPSAQNRPMPESPGIGTPRRAQLLKQAQALAETRFFDAAIALFDELLAADPSDLEAKNGRANAVALKNRPKP